MTHCFVCDKEVYKYTCPACSIQYCSLSCYNSHKNNQCDEIKQQRESQNPEQNFSEDRVPNRMIFDTIDTVPAEKLEQLKHSDELKKLLQNKHLKDFLQELNDARNPWKAMKVAMTEPLFLEFADECLKVIENDTNDS